MKTIDPDAPAYPAIVPTAIIDGKGELLRYEITELSHLPGMTIRAKMLSECHDRPTNENICQISGHTRMGQWWLDWPIEKRISIIAKYQLMLVDAKIAELNKGSGK